LPHVALAELDMPSDPTTAPPRKLTVQEAINIALSNSEVVRNLGLVDAHSEVDIVRGLLTTFDPLEAHARADAEWGIFDPVWTTSMQWNRNDVPPGTSFGGIGNIPPQLDTHDFSSSVEQLLPLGTSFEAGYVTDYLFNPQHPAGLNPNPQYFSYAQFGITQPLGQGLGVNVTMAPIRIAAARAEGTDWAFKQEVLALVRSVETAYWSLYAEQQNLQVIDESLPHFREIVRIREQQARGPAGTELDVARAKADMLLLEQRRLDTLSRISEQQLVIRDLMGLAPNDGYYMSLVALPDLSPPVATVQESIQTAVNRRPDVLRQRLVVYAAQQERILARDALRPTVDFGTFWRINGLGNDLGSSMEVLNDNDYHDWQLGLLVQVPIGRREARANLRAADYMIQKERSLLDQKAHQASFEVADAYRRIIWLHQQHQVAVDRVAALKTWRQGAKAQFDNPPPGMSTSFALELYLQNLRELVDASVSAQAIIADYNSALARLEEVKGTLLEKRLIVVDGDATDNVPRDFPVPSIQPAP
jgi:outer membrane protein TolC